jgi:hypothetical protein
LARYAYSGGGRAPAEGYPSIDVGGLGPPQPRHRQSAQRRALASYNLDASSPGDLLFRPAEERLTRSGGDQPWPTRSCITFLVVRRNSARNRLQQSIQAGAAFQPVRSSTQPGPRGGRLDDHGRARLQGELGTIPGSDSHAENEAGYRRGIGWATPGNCIRSSHATVASQHFVTRCE